MGTDLHHIVVVGGGVGGLELATALGDRLGKHRRARITLIDRNRTHFWKPHLHEIAAGSMNLSLYELSYAAQGHWHGFSNRLGEMVGLDRGRRLVQVAPHLDEHGERITPLRAFHYDTLVLAVGSQLNDFGTPGVRDHAIALETPDQADQFHRRLVNACVRAHSQAEALRPEQLQVAIIGAGATGVELAAQLPNSTRALLRYGLDRIDYDRHIGIHLIEAGPRVLPALPQRFSEAAARQLAALQVTVHTRARVQEVVAGGVRLEGGYLLPAELVVWAAGIKAPDFLAELQGLATNHSNQLLVQPSLQTTRDAHVFAIGDCAACAWPGHEPAWVPARAQAAHQQAAHLAIQLPRHLQGRPLKPWRYRDHGSLVALGQSKTVGLLTSAVLGGDLWLEGYLARLMYGALYQGHQLALHGFWKTLLEALAHFITRRTEPQVKLH